jgi:single-strand DNA-binding protein
MASLNKVFLIGNAGRDPEVRHLDSGVSVATFTLATSERFKDRNGNATEQTEWHNIVAWRQLADLADNYIRKGSPLYIEGRIRSRKYINKDNVEATAYEILADRIELLGSKGDNQYEKREPQPERRQQTNNVDDFPF